MGSKMRKGRLCAFSTTLYRNIIALCKNHVDYIFSGMIRSSSWSGLVSDAHGILNLLPLHGWIFVVKMGLNTERCEFIIYRLFWSRKLNVWPWCVHKFQSTNSFSYLKSLVQYVQWGRCSVSDSIHGHNLWTLRGSVPKQYLNYCSMRWKSSSFGAFLALIMCTKCSFIVSSMRPLRNTFLWGVN